MTKAKQPSPSGKKIAHKSSATKRDEKTSSKPIGVSDNTTKPEARTIKSAPKEGKISRAAIKHAVKTVTQSHKKPK